MNKCRKAMIVSLGMCAVASAQYTTHTSQLVVGWNSVFLPLDPAAADADVLFAGLPIETVWTLADPRTIRPPNCQGADSSDPDCANLISERWWVWVPPNSPKAPIRTLRRITGGRVYLIKASAPTTLNVVGEPSSARTQYRTGLNLIGFHVVEDPLQTPSFSAFLSPSNSLGTAKVYSIAVSGAASQITSLTTAKIAAGKGYWVQATSDETYGGPIQIDTESLRGIDYAESLVEHSLRLENRASVSRTVTVRYLSSLAPPAQTPVPMRAGDVPLEWLDYGSGSNPQNLYQWRDLTSKAWALTQKGTDGAIRTMRIAVDRAGLASANVDTEGLGSEYQGLLEITDGAGFRRLLPVSAQVTGDQTVAGASSPHVGLWHGHAVINKVSWVTSSASADDDSTTPRPAWAEFSFPILVHVGADGTSRFLTEVSLMWQPGAQQEEAGTYVLVTPSCPPAVRSQLEAGSLRDGRPFSRRLSTAAFGFDGDLAMQGAPGSELSVTIDMLESHRLNPFKHRYHPDHDCDQVGECYEFSRELHLAFQGERPAGVTLAGWGDTVIGGTYTETINGIHRDPVYVEGTFQLRKVIGIGSLNAQ